MANGSICNVTALTRVAPTPTITSLSAMNGNVIISPATTVLTNEPIGSALK